MKKNVRCIEVLLFVVFNLLFSQQGYAQNEYAVLLFGGSGDERIDVPDSLYVIHEIAPMYNTLRTIYEYPAANIWVLNLDADEEDYYEYFDPDVPDSRYMSASIENFIITLDSINSIISQNNSNQLLFYISGHQGAGTDPNAYQFYEGRLLDEEFADSVDTHLLANGVDSNTRFIYVIGSCSGYGFWDDLSADVDTISFAAADTAIGFNTITAGPKFSFMYYWRETSHNIINASINDIFNVAKDSMECNK